MEWLGHRHKKALSVMPVSMQASPARKYLECAAAETSVEPKRHIVHGRSRHAVMEKYEYSVKLAGDRYEKKVRDCVGVDEKLTPVCCINVIAGRTTS